MRSVSRRNNGAAAATLLCLITTFLLLLGTRPALSQTQTATTNQTDGHEQRGNRQELDQAAKEDEPPDPAKSLLEAQASPKAEKRQGQIDTRKQQNTFQHSKSSPHASFLIMDKKAHLSVIRIQQEPGEPGFIGYTEKGVSIVTPHTPVRVVLFGSFLDDIVLIGFTASENCSQTMMNIHQEDFTIQTERRIVIIYEFEESKSIYKICMKQKANNPDYDLSFAMIDDMRCSVSTDLPRRNYYFPMGVQIFFVACWLLGLSAGFFFALNHPIWVTRFFMVLTFPLAYPISRVLDLLLGDEVV